MHIEIAKMIRNHMSSAIAVDRESEWMKTFVIQLNVVEYISILCHLIIVYMFEWLPECNLALRICKFCGKRSTIMSKFFNAAGTITHRIAHVCIYLRVLNFWSINLI